MTSVTDPPLIAVFTSFSGLGGVERMIVNLCNGLAHLGCRVDLLLARDKAPHLAVLDPAVRLVKLPASHTLGALFPLARYLRETRPNGLIAAKDRANQAAVIAKRLARVDTRVITRLGTTVSASISHRNPLTRLFWRLPMRLTYRLADAVVAVSMGVATDLAVITGLPQSTITVIPNPVITPDFLDRASEKTDHPWLAEGTRPGCIPVILGMGRLTRQKDFPTLMRAFGLVRSQKPCRLLILGEGGDRPKLEAMAGDLGLSDDVSLPGFVANPYPLFARASLFVLSSAWEGSPNVLTEALALGVPVVSTDCPSGPWEILDGGKYGPLVPVGNHEALAEAMLRTIENPPEKAFLQKAARAYTQEEASRRYLALLLGR